MDEKLLEERIRQIIRRELMKKEDPNPDFNKAMSRMVDSSGVIGIKGDSVKCCYFPTGDRADEVYLRDVVSLEESPRLGTGYMEILKDKPFKWTLKYDEVDVILEGTLEIITEHGKIKGSKGDTIFIPKGSSITFTCPEGEKTRFVYVTYPADWQEGN